MKERIYTERMNVTLSRTFYFSIKEYIDEIGISNSKFTDLALNHFFNTNAIITSKVLRDARFKEGAEEPLTERFICYLSNSMNIEIKQYAKANGISKIKVVRQALIDYLEFLKK